MPELRFAEAILCESSAERSRICSGFWVSAEPFSSNPKRTERDRIALPQQNAASVFYQVVAARSTPTGALHEFQQLGTEVMDASSGVDSSAYKLDTLLRQLAWGQTGRGGTRRDDKWAGESRSHSPPRQWCSFEARAVAWVRGSVQISDDAHQR